LRRYRRFLVAFSLLFGVALGIGLGSLAALAGRFDVVLLAAPVVALALIGSARAKRATIAPTTPIWAGVTVVAASTAFLVVPRDLAPIGLGLSVALWFALLVIGGVLEILLDRDGRFANTPD
jgi:hypothetical protein